MKVEALLVAAAMAVSGSAFAAGTAKADSTAGKQMTTETKVVKKKTVKKSKSKATQRQQMGASAAMPATDLNARERQSRMDEAYDKWRSARPATS